MPEIVVRTTGRVVVSSVQIGGGGSAADFTGWIYIGDINTQAGPISATAKTFQDSNDTVLQTVTTPVTTLAVDVRSSYPLVTVDGNAATLTRDAGGGYYSGTVNITVSGSKDVTAQVVNPNGGNGALDTATVTVSLAPVIQTAIFTGGYPGAQTELKAGDSFTLRVTADKSFDQVVLADFGVSGSDTINVTPGAGPTDVTVTIADRGTIAQQLAARLQVRDSVTGALSASFDTDSSGSVDGTNVLTLNNLFPSGAISSIVYPGAQAALKGVEVATVNHTASDFDVISYVDPTGTDISIANPSTFEAAKVATSLNPGTFNNSSTNFRYTMTRNANAAVTVVNGVVVIADVAVVISVSFSGARVRSGSGVGEDTVITISGDQPLLNAPTMDPAASRGTFQGGGFTGGPTSWTRTLRVTDAENPTDGSSNTWLNLVATNLAATVTSVITTGPTYVVGGFAPRTLNYAPFTANSTETFPLTTEANLSIGVFSNGNTGVVQPFGTADTSDVGKEGWWAPNAASGVTTGRMLHAPSVSANSSGITLTAVEEAA